MSSYSSFYFKPLLYISTVLLLTSLIVLAYFASDLQRFEKQCKNQLILFQSFEQSAWKDIIKLERFHTRTKRKATHNIQKKRKARRSKLRKWKKPKEPVLFKKQLVPVANELTELDEYRNSDWKKETENEKESENSSEIEETTTKSSPEEVENPDEAETDVEDTEKYTKEGENDAESSEDNTESEGIRNMSTREMKIKYGMTDDGLAQLLEVDNDENEEEEEEDENGDSEGYETGEDNGNEQECADTDLKCYGNPCPRGPAGPPGVPGNPGEDAPDGVDGGNGTEWELHAEDRVIVLGCVKCPVGPRGVEGDPGPPGDKGGIGKNGNPGLDGYEGFPGQTGHEGEAGYDGEYGPDGWPGQRGQDSKIYRNLPGPPGPPGVTGPPGENGGYGNLGYGGTEGIAGVAGAPGHHGIPGPPGAPGAPGEPGTSGEYVGQCKCPERRRPIGGGGGGGYPVPSPSYYPAPPVNYQLNYQTTTVLYYPAPTSSDYSTEAVYVGATTETPTTSIYRYYVKAAAPGFKTSSESEYVETTTTYIFESSVYSVEKESQYVEGLQQKTSSHLTDSGSFKPPEDHLPISDSEK